MSVRTLLLLRGAVTLVMLVCAVVAYATGNTVVGVLLTAFVLTNVVLIITVANRQTDVAWRLLGIPRRRR